MFSARVLGRVSKMDSLLNIDTGVGCLTTGLGFVSVLFDHWQACVLVKRRCTI